MENNEFAILHTIDGLQVLILSDFDHDKDEYSIHIKFWSEFVNGYCTVGLKWKGSQTVDFEKTFDSLKSQEKAKIWMYGIRQKLGEDLTNEH